MSPTKLATPMPSSTTRSHRITRTATLAILADLGLALAACGGGFIAAATAALKAFEAQHPSDPQMADRITNPALRATGCEKLNALGLPCGGRFAACYRFNSCLRQIYRGYRSISCIKSPRREASGAGWRVAA